VTGKQRRFIDEYLVDLNATHAAIRAGYSAKTAYSAGQRLLKHVDVAPAIAEATAERVERTELTQDYVVENLTEVVERCMQRAPVWVRRGREVTQLTDADGQHVWQFDARGAVSALTLLGKHLGIFAERHEHTGKDGGPIEHREVSDADLKQRLTNVRNRIAAFTGPSEN
jgi:phage terminase small subunit